MGVQKSDQRLELIVNGTASADLEWRGGEGVATLTGLVGNLPGGGIQMQMSPNNGANWISVAMYGAGSTAVVEWTTELHELPFKLPACRLRASATGVGFDMLVVSV